MKILKIDKKGSVLIQTKESLKIWVDVWEEGNDIFADWNKYIFYLNDSEDLKIKKFQEEPNNYMECTSFVIEFFENNKNKFYV